MATHKVGGEVDAFCTRCKMTLAHTILAMVGTKIVRVKCNTCNGDHAYRKEPGSRARAQTTTNKSKKSSRPVKVIIGWDERLAGKDTQGAAKYAPAETYAVEQLINHPSFGLGIVSAVRDDKVEVTFKGDTKTLVHGRGESAVAKPAFQKSKAGARTGPADKPITEMPEPEEPPPPELDETTEVEAVEGAQE
jgi:hypothetical protein